jgi:hypothetical protein
MRKYVVYAVGEIVLIIAGVLIALTVAEWNGKRNDKNSETKFLKEISKSLDLSKSELEIKLLEVKSVINGLYILDSLLEHEDHPYSPSMDTLFGSVYGYRLFTLHRANYDDLKENSLTLVRDDSIRHYLNLVFEKGNKSLDDINQIEVEASGSVTRPYYMTNFHNIEIRKSASPNDYEFIWNDTYFKNLVNYRINNLEMNQRSFYSDILAKIEKLIQLINKYVDA